jgi:glucose/arabinose dehydrogenase
MINIVLKSASHVMAARWPAVILLAAGALMTSTQIAAAVDLSGFSLPEGFSIEVLVDDIPSARSMALGDEGTLFVGTQMAGKVYAVRDVFSAEPEVITILEKRKMSNGVAFRDGDLYVAESMQILLLKDIESRLDEPFEPEIIVGDLPFKNALHSWKYIAFGPDGDLYVPLGMPCNICEEPGFGVLLRMKADGSEREVYVTGIRNTVGFDWHPNTGELWFTDNGRDMLGDDIPPGELNHSSGPGRNFGFPFCHGADIADPDFGHLGRCEDAEPPVQELGPHVAPLGMKFYTGDMFPAEYKNQVFIAEHGSWNRSKDAGVTGYRVTLVRLDGNESISYEPFLDGFFRAGQAVGRPVDILVAPDGALLVSDDKGGVIYRISYKPGDTAATAAPTL